MNNYCNNPECRKPISIIEQMCSYCSQPLIGFLESVGFNKLQYYRLPFSYTLADDNLKYFIMYGMYSVFDYKGVNCQTFANFYINLMRNKPFKYKKTFFKKKYKSIVKRIQMMKYLFDINKQFLEINKGLIGKDYEDLMKRVNVKYNKYLEMFTLDDYCFGDNDLKNAIPKRNLFKSIKLIHDMMDLEKLDFIESHRSFDLVNNEDNYVDDDIDDDIEVERNEAEIDFYINKNKGKIII